MTYDSSSEIRTEMKSISRSCLVRDDHISRLQVKVCYFMFVKNPNSFQELPCKRIADRPENRDGDAGLTIPSAYSFEAFVLVCSFHTLVIY